MISGPVVDMLERNKHFSEDYQSPPGLLQLADMAKAAGEGVVVLSCSDPRVNPEGILGLDQNLRATMVRNAGGRAFDAIRTLAVLQTIASPATIVVMQHTDCGLTHYHDAAVREALAEFAPSEKSKLAKMEFGEITGSIDDSVREDIALLRSSPLIKESTQLIGLKYDTFSGKLSVVE